MVGVAQLVEPRIVIPVVMSSNLFAYPMKFAIMLSESMRALCEGGVHHPKSYACFQIGPVAQLVRAGHS